MWYMVDAIAKSYAVVTYKCYNVCSWMKSITNPLFSQTLYYNERRTTNASNSPSYSGNISGMDWTVGTESGKLRGYDFTYDGLSRLTAANYLENNAAGNKFSTAYTYDKHGNMLSLLRSGNLGTTTYGQIDNLTLAYNGNQLIKVEDTAVNPALSMSMDFRNGADQATEYTYDKNGNQTQDLNRGITNTEYNILNLPRLENHSLMAQNILSKSYNKWIRRTIYFTLFLKA